MVAGRRVDCCTGGTLRLLRGGKDDVGEGGDSEVDDEVVRMVEVGGGAEEVVEGRLEGDLGAGGTLTGTGRPDSTASWSVVFLAFEWKSFKFFKGLLVVTALRERIREEGGRVYDRKVSTFRFAELEISFLI